MFRFQKDKGRFLLQSVHPGETLESIRAHTGFDFDVPERVEQTPPPTDEELALIRGEVGVDISETYPAFAARVLELNENRP